MGYLWHVFLAVAIQALGESGVVGGSPFPLGVVLLALVPLAFGKLARRRALAGDFPRAALCARLVQLSPPLCFLAAVGLFAWVPTVRAWTGAELGLASWPEPALLFSLAPFLLYQVATIIATARILEEGPAPRKRWRTFQLRMLLSACLPLVLYVGLAALIGLSDVARVHVERVAVWNAVFLGGLLLTLALILPTILRNAWETTPFPEGVHREVLEGVGQLADFDAKRLLVWNTGGQMANAAIVGLLPRGRTVLLSDSLISMLNLRQLAAVYGHEIGHAKRHHVPLFLAFAAAFFLGGELFSRWIDPTGGWLSTLLLMVAIALWIPVFGWLSRRFELEADLFSLRLLKDPQAMIDALERVGGRLRDVAGWRHFSTSDRVAFLERAAEDEPFVTRFLRRLRVLSWVGVTAAVVCVGLQVSALFEYYTEDRVYAELSLGRYAEAAQLAEAEPDLDPDLRDLVGFAQATGVSAASAEPGAAQAPEASWEVHLGEGLNAALIEQRPADALRFAQLLLLRGRQDLLLLVDVLEAHVSGEADAARFLADGLEPQWRALTAELLAE